MPVTPPNFTQIPNELLDKMNDMSPAEFKVMMAICRKTFGWQKSHDVISLSQLEEMTGLSRTAVQSGIMAGIERGMLERTKAGKQSYSYHLLVASDYQSTQTTSSPKLPEPVVSDYQQLVASDYTQNKGLNKKQSGGDTRNGNAAAAVDQVLVARLMDEQMLMRDQATKAAALDCMTCEVIDRLKVWRDDMIERNRHLPQQKQKRPQAILWYCLKQGVLPDDLPPPPPPTLSDEEVMQRYLADFHRKPVHPSDYR